MNKTVIFLCSLLLLWTGCSNENAELIGNPEGMDASLSKVRWYGTHLVEDVQTRGVADGAKRWNPDAGIYIKFLNAPANPLTLEKVKQIAVEWETYAGIKFNFVEADKNAEVRIAFDWMGNDWLTWSYTGTDAKYVRSQSQPTAVFGGLDDLDEEMFKGDVLRLFGQILGLEYEQRHQEWSKNGYWKKESQLQNYWETQFEDTGYAMEWDEIREYVFVPLTGINASQLMETKAIDEQSVMAWPYYNIRQTSKVLANFELSEGDKAFIARLYPKNGTTLPTIQEAWVDAGYFVWTDATKTALRITVLGKEQEYLPDVCDGEQLTSAYQMFKESRVIAVPTFNTVNIVDFNRMFQACKFITSIPYLNTSKGTIFCYMFEQCSSLTTIPHLNTSNGIFFGSMFEQCSSLTTIPHLDTSKGVNFITMFYQCSSLTTIPNLNTSMGVSFKGMFASCNSLTSIPHLDTSKGHTFSDMFYDCRVLTSIPHLDTSNGIIFSSMFRDCSALSSIPNLNTSKGSVFDYMFYKCSVLTSIPDLDISNGRDFSRMFSECNALTFIPHLDTSNGTIFTHMFSNCRSLNSIPNLDTSKGINFSHMFYQCSSLTCILNLDTSNGINFSYMFFQCRSLTIQPVLNLSSATDITDMYKYTLFG